MEKGCSAVDGCLSGCDSQPHGLALNMLGGALRDVLDPRLRQGRR
jgi:hypothetical protein